MSALVFKRPLMRSRLSEEVERVLLKDIITGNIAVGEKLPTERDLARSLEVNRSTVREALSRLESWTWSRSATGTACTSRATSRAAASSSSGP